MMAAPTAFEQDARRIAEKTTLVCIIPHETRGTTCIPGSRDLVEDLRAFHQRWNGRVTDPKARAIVEQFHQHCLALEDEIELLYLRALRDLAEARRKWKLAETFVEAQVALGELVKHCPAALLPELMAALRGDAKEEVDLVDDFRWALSEADAAEAAYKKERREFEENWGDRMTDPFFQTIDGGEPAAASPLIEAAVEKRAGLTPPAGSQNPS